MFVRLLYDSNTHLLDVSLGRSSSSSSASSSSRPSSPPLSSSSLLKDRDKHSPAGVELFRQQAKAAAEDQRRESTISVRDLQLLIRERIVRDARIPLSLICVVDYAPPITGSEDFVASKHVLADMERISTCPTAEVAESRSPTAVLFVRSRLVDYDRRRKALLRRGLAWAERRARDVERGVVSVSQEGVGGGGTSQGREGSGSSAQRNDGGAHLVRCLFGDVKGEDNCSLSEATDVLRHLVSEISSKFVPIVPAEQSVGDHRTTISSLADRRSHRISVGSVGFSGSSPGLHPEDMSVDDVDIDSSVREFSGVGGSSSSSSSSSSIDNPPLPRAGQRTCRKTNHSFIATTHVERLGREAAPVLDVLFLTSTETVRDADELLFHCPAELLNRRGRGSRGRSLLDHVLRAHAGAVGKDGIIDRGRSAEDFLRLSGYAARRLRAEHLATALLADPRFLHGRTEAELFSGDVQSPLSTAIRYGFHGIAMAFAGSIRSDGGGGAGEDEKGKNPDFRFLSFHCLTYGFVEVARRTQRHCAWIQELALDRSAGGVDPGGIVSGLLETTRNRCGALVRENLPMLADAIEGGGSSCAGKKESCSTESLEAARPFGTIGGTSGSHLSGSGAPCRTVGVYQNALVQAARGDDDVESARNGLVLAQLDRFMLEEIAIRLLVAARRRELEEIINLKKDVARVVLDPALPRIREIAERFGAFGVVRVLDTTLQSRGGESSCWSCSGEVGDEWSGEASTQERLQDEHVVQTVPTYVVAATKGLEEMLAEIVEVVGRTSPVKRSFTSTVSLSLSQRLEDRGTIEEDSVTANFDATILKNSGPPDHQPSSSSSFSPPRTSSLAQQEAHDQPRSTPPAQSRFMDLYEKALAGTTPRLTVTTLEERESSHNSPERELHAEVDDDEIETSKGDGKSPVSSVELETLPMEAVKSDGICPAYVEKGHGRATASTAPPTSVFSVDSVWSVSDSVWLRSPPVQLGRLTETQHLEEADDLHNGRGSVSVGQTVDDVLLRTAEGVEEVKDESGSTETTLLEDVIERQEVISSQVDEHQQIMTQEIMTQERRHDDPPPNFPAEGDHAGVRFRAMPAQSPVPQTSTPRKIDVEVVDVCGTGDCASGAIVNMENNHDALEDGCRSGRSSDKSLFERERSVEAPPEAGLNTTKHSRRVSDGSGREEDKGSVEAVDGVRVALIPDSTTRTIQSTAPHGHGGPGAEVRSSEVPRELESLLQSDSEQVLPAAVPGDAEAAPLCPDISVLGDAEAAPSSSPSLSQREREITETDESEHTKKLSMSLEESKRVAEEAIRNFAPATSDVSPQKNDGTAPHGGPGAEVRSSEEPLESLLQTDSEQVLPAAAPAGLVRNRSGAMIGDAEAAPSSSCRGAPHSYDESPQSVNVSAAPELLLLPLPAGSTMDTVQQLSADDAAETLAPLSPAVSVQIHPADSLTPVLQREGRSLVEEDGPTSFAELERSFGRATVGISCHPDHHPVVEDHNDSAPGDALLLPEDDPDCAVIRVSEVGDFPAGRLPSRVSEADAAVAPLSPPSISAVQIYPVDIDSLTPDVLHQRDERRPLVAEDGSTSCAELERSFGRGRATVSGHLEAEVHNDSAARDAPLLLPHPEEPMDDYSVIRVPQEDDPMDDCAVLRFPEKLNDVIGDFPAGACSPLQCSSPLRHSFRARLDSASRPRRSWTGTEGSMSRVSLESLVQGVSSPLARRGSLSSSGGGTSPRSGPLLGSCSFSMHIDEEAQASISDNVVGAREVLSANEADEGAWQGQRPAQPRGPVPFPEQLVESSPPAGVSLSASVLTLEGMPFDNTDESPIATEAEDASLAPDETLPMTAAALDTGTSHEESELEDNERENRDFVVIRIMDDRPNELVSPEEPLHSSETIARTPSPKKRWSR